MKGKDKNTAVPVCLSMGKQLQSETLETCWEIKYQSQNILSLKKLEDDGQGRKHSSTSLKHRGKTTVIWNTSNFIGRDE